MKAGTSKRDISPGKGIELAGYPHHPRHNTGIHDKLYASCIYLSNNNEEVMIISLDILFLSKKYVRTIREKISERTGINAGNISISCTHTHSGPWASGRLDKEALENEAAPDMGYISDLIENITEAACAAYDNTFTAMIGSASGRCGKEKGVGGNRRAKDGITDPEVGVLAVSDEKGRIKACVINYALHPTLLHADNTLVSADYPGYVRKYLEDRYPGINVLFLQGCSGNQSTRYFRTSQTFEEAKRIGEEIAGEAERVMGNIKYKTSADISVKNAELDIKLRTFPAKTELIKAVEKARIRYSSLKSENAPYVDIQNANVTLLGAEDILGYAQMMEKGKKIELLEDEKPIELKVINIGGLMLAFTPGELFVEFGLEIKNAYAKGMVFVAGLSNGCLPGYVYTKEALDTGGYETDTSLLAEDMGDIIAERLSGMFEEMAE